MFDLVLQAGPVVKLVLLILVYFSLVSWAIIFYKFTIVQKAIKESDRFLDFFWSKKRFDVVGQGIKDFSNSPLATLFREGYHEMLQLKKKSANPDEDHDFSSEMDTTEIVGRALRRATTQETHRLEKYLTFLATTGSTAPFIGLFGTVWGIMDAFHGIGQTGSASLAVVAPGISEALIATAIGLAAAIPAVMGYNHFLNKVNVLIGEMDNFSQEFLNIVERMERS
ncbi:Cell division and transport-associated protein TolQ [Malonomonas rubra DSM 5091]|uniref:Cell division and transport-associated protein TolQ n=1 Tax=Malonomonas rubra DSM 5091 TaxID=1122189 RepID=A0A1M6JRU6_MALRU|nr:protein TolQ [Malonomonas rubra]SHJ49457.1 Cell division and transport-associated protein TolQ [Malonomonas rubra DSM 5091]